MLLFIIFFYIILALILTWFIYLLYRVFFVLPKDLYLNRKKANFTKHLFILVLTFITLYPYFSYKNYQENVYKELLPLELETSGRELIHDSFDFREGCGVAIFNLSNSTLSAINSKGLKFFEHAIYPRAGINKDKKYESWDAIKNHISRKHNLLNCTRELSISRQNEIDRAIATKRGFYTGRNGVSLVVLPSLGYAVYSVSD